MKIYKVKEKIVPDQDGGVAYQLLSNTDEVGSCLFLSGLDRCVKIVRVDC